MGANFANTVRQGDGGDALTFESGACDFRNMFSLRRQGRNTKILIGAIPYTNHTASTVAQGSILQSRAVHKRLLRIGAFRIRVREHAVDFGQKPVRVRKILAAAKHARAKKQGENEKLFHDNLPIDAPIIARQGEDVKCFDENNP